MYTKTYAKDIPSIQIPEQYGGTVFGDTVSEIDVTYEKEPENTPTITEENKNPWEQSEKNATRDSTSIPTADLGGMFSKFGEGFFGIRGFKNPKAIFSDGFGTEEILIIGLALLMLLSSDRDIECALMILALLFIK